MGAIIFGKFLGKWAFIPVILIEWCLFVFFIQKYSGKTTIQTWLRKPIKNWGWTILTIMVGLTPLPIFLMIIAY